MKLYAFLVVSFVLTEFNELDSIISAYNRMNIMSKRKHYLTLSKQSKIHEYIIYISNMIIGSILLIPISLLTDYLLSEPIPFIVTLLIFAVILFASYYILNGIVWLITTAYDKVSYYLLKSKIESRDK